ncbi:putative calcium-transporting ATPase 13, plasma membrane-type [Vitis vinifera]|uniref:Putative calcium-transporting ATPase 13, plasma membrane-type n=1 Tax=Vitis vinifera TaxID=29760 RepID=A0A438KKM7_VITVI|nr:putative calcium-transporting ATPase 13, plasma membrane-type [Vitis vinifera]
MSNNLDLSLVCMESLLEVPSTLSNLRKDGTWPSLPFIVPGLYTPFSIILSPTIRRGAKPCLLHPRLLCGHYSRNRCQKWHPCAVEDVTRRRKAFGSNAYRKPPTKSFFYFVVEAIKDVTILILVACATLSLGFGIKEQGPKEGWYDGGSILVAVFLVISVSAVSNFSRIDSSISCLKSAINIQVDVVRDGRRQQISIFEVVVGDVVCLKIGDQVPADGLFLDGHSLQVDESSMTGESDHVEVNTSLNPFLFSGTKVADGYARMVVTLLV